MLNNRHDKYVTLHRRSYAPQRNTYNHIQMRDNEFSRSKSDAKATVNMYIVGTFYLYSKSFILVSCEVAKIAQFDKSINFMNKDSANIKL